MFDYFKLIDTDQLNYKLGRGDFPFSQQLFWESAIENIDLQKHKRYIVERVLTRGFTADFYLLLKIYTTDEIKEALCRSKSLDPKTIHFCSWFLISPNKTCMFHPSIINTPTYSTLKAIFSYEEIKQNFALAGGTSLALQLRHRHSIDLDIFSPLPINSKEIELNISSDSELKLQLANSNKNMLFAYINSIKCDFIYEPAKLLKPFVVNDGINYFSVPDIAAMKLHTICGRGRK